MFKDPEISAAASKLIDAGYTLGLSDGSSFDCLTMVWHFYGCLGISLPREFKGYSAENYAGRWQAGEGRAELKDYLTSLGEEVPANYERSGDMLVFDAGKWVFPGIYLGNGHFLAAFEKGCKVVPYRFFKHAVIARRRIGCQQR